MNLFSFTQPLRDHRWFGFVFGLFAVGAAYSIRVLLGPMALNFPFVIFIPFVVLTTFLGGIAPGIMAAVLSGVLADLTLIAPAGSIWPSWPEGWSAMFFYALTVGIDIALIQGMISANLRALVAERDLRTLNEGLEREVETRTGERDRAQDALRQSQKMESLGQLTGGIAHDFNNMLAIVIGNLDMARRHLKKSEIAVEPYLERAREGAARAAILTERLLAFSRQTPLSPKVINLNQRVATMSELLHRTLGERISLETVLAGGLWLTNVDPNQIEAALLNLAVNARDAMPDGGKLTIETANVVLDAQYTAAEVDLAPGQYVMTAVTDLGTGIPSELLGKVFDPFFTTKPAGKGTGLGLSMVYGFAKQSGGHVRIYSEVGKGTAVKLYLPRYFGSAVEANERVPEPAKLARALRSETVLVVEDDDRVRQMSCEALRELGYIVHEAASGEGALKAFGALERVDVLFTDVVMAGMSGRELADALQKQVPSLKVLYTTGYTRNAVVHNGVLDFGVALLSKPFTIETLALKMRTILGD
jgi:signal transduction histidine kinase/CheY-like chemotaxis protein